MSALGPMAGPPPQALPIPPQLMGGPGGPPVGTRGDGDPGGAGEDAAEAAALKRAASALEQAFRVESDPADKAEIAKLVAAVHKMLAGRAKEVDQAVGVGPGLKLAQRMAR